MRDQIEREAGDTSGSGQSVSNKLLADGAGHLKAQSPADRQKFYSGLRTDSSTAHLPPEFALVAHGASDGAMPPDRVGALATAEHTTKGWDSFSPPNSDDVQSRIGHNSMIYWGDFHPDDKSVDRLINSLKPLKESGVSTVGVEGLDPKAQGLVRDWLSEPNGSSRSEELEGKIHSMLKDAQPDKPEDSPDARKLNGIWRDKTFQLLQGIKAAGLDVLGLEPAKANYDQADRDPSWQNKVRAFSATHPGEKLLVFGGTDHFTPIDSFTKRAAADHISTVDLTPPSQYRKSLDTALCGGE